MQKYAQLLFCLLLIFLVTTPQTAQAHPHVWIRYAFKITSTHDGMNRLDFTWHLDDMFSSIVTEDLKANNLTLNDGNLTKAHAFADLSNNKYFLDIRFDGQMLTFNDVQNFTMATEDNHLVYRFSLGLPKPVQKLSMSIRDPSIYVDFMPDSESTIRPTNIPSSVMELVSKDGSNLPSCTWRRGAGGWAPFPIYVIACDMAVGGPSPVNTQSSNQESWDIFLTSIADAQKRIHQSITDQIETLKTGQSFTALWLLLAMSFGYGVFHVLAPGHGKVILGSYFLGHKTRWRDSFIASFLMATGHTVSAIGIVVVAYLLLGLSQFRILQDARYIELIGYALITAIGLGLLYKAATNTQPHACCHGHHSHHEHHTHNHNHTLTPKNKISIGLFAITGLVPCTGSIIVLLFTLANHVLWAGILAVIAIALGMFLTMSALSIISAYIRHKIISEEQSPFQIRMTKALRMVSATIVIMTGSILAASVIHDMMG